MISALRNFIKFLYEEKIINQDLSKKIPSYKRIKQPKLPSVYSGDEIKRLLSSIERSSPIGKRNYAIILIASSLGLRASDIAHLKFENLKWDCSTIELNQVKTDRQLILPLMPDVGNAIIDYIKYGRPKSNEPFVFLTERPPYCPFPNSNVITHVVQRAFTAAGININGRKFGSHSLRHSLAFRMLEKSTTLPVISEVLGHGNSESTLFYLRIDLNSMKQCILEVPPINSRFYTTNENFFYA
jgi:integrase